MASHDGLRALRHPDVLDNLARDAAFARGPNACASPARPARIARDLRRDMAASRSRRTTAFGVRPSANIVAGSRRHVFSEEESGWNVVHSSSMRASRASL
ncbi:MAG: hypothetical protein ACHP91_07145, partial [Burkholderiales bacterium]